MRRAAIILAIGAAAVAGAFAYCGLPTSARVRENEQTPQVPILVARANVPAWERLEAPEQFFEVRHFPIDVVPADAVSEFDEVKGQWLRTPVAEGKLLLHSALAPDHVRVVLRRVRPGRSPTVITVAWSMGGFIRPGSCVDVVCTFDRPDLSAQVILQNVLVLDINELDAKEAKNASPGSCAVTLAATPEEASKLSYFSRMGEFRLCVRRPDDEDG